MLVALRPLRRAAILAAQVEGCQLSLLQPVRQFDEALPGLGTMRNVGEHIDGYIMVRPNGGTVMLVLAQLASECGDPPE